MISARPPCLSLVHLLRSSCRFPKPFYIIMPEYLCLLNSKAADFLISYGAKKKPPKRTGGHFNRSVPGEFTKNNQRDRSLHLHDYATLIYGSSAKGEDLFFYFFYFPLLTQHISSCTCRCSCLSCFVYHGGPTRAVSPTSTGGRCIKHISKSIQLSFVGAFTDALLLLKINTTDKKNPSKQDRISIGSRLSIILSGAANRQLLSFHFVSRQTVTAVLLVR